MAGSDGAADLHGMMKMFWDRQDFDVPAGTAWHIVVDTFAASPHDIADPGSEELLAGYRCSVEGRSIVVLERKE